jgi:hypothetical protein
MKPAAPRARRWPRARGWRLLLIALVAAGLAPGTFVRTAIGNRTDPAVVTITPLKDRSGVSGDLALTGVWELGSAHNWFGGFSALVAGEGQTLIAGTDRGFLFNLDLTGDAPRAAERSYRFVGVRKGPRAEVLDLESLARDPASGTLWAGFEKYNLVMRFAPDGTRTWRPAAAMAQWGQNSGPETMDRLTDGRFMAIAEGAEDGSETVHDALLYPGDPLGPGKPLAFRFVAPAGYDPVDATQVPGGRVLILLRRVEYALPPRFDTAIAIADPAAIRSGKPWRARIIQRMTGGIFADNFEGIAFVASPEDSASGSIWVISDDNFSVFQRNLLVRFDWKG